MDAIIERVGGVDVGQVKYSLGNGTPDGMG